MIGGWQDSMTLVTHHLQLHHISFNRSILPVLRTSSETKRSITYSTIQMGISNYASTDGEFRRKDSSFRNHIEVGGKYPPEKDRYHLYVSWACPWGTSFPVHVC
jgi:hypothetical protein